MSNNDRAGASTRAPSTALQSGLKASGSDHTHHIGQHHMVRVPSEGGGSLQSRKILNRKSTKSLRHSSCGGDSLDREDRAFIYPCHAFKQFILTLKEGKIDLNDLGKYPEKLKEAMNKSSDLGKEYEKMQKRMNKSKKDLHKNAINSHQLEVCNRLTMGVSHRGKHMG